MENDQTPDAVNADIQDLLTKTTPPMDITVATRLLIELKSIMDEFGVRFFLRQGTCLGAVRDKAFIPWDDDLDIGIILGHDGFSEESIPSLLQAFIEHGYYVDSEPAESLIISTLSKDNLRIDLLFHRIVNGQVYHWPGVWFPARLFDNLTTIEFLGTNFLVPSPPEEYLKIKYGPEWKTPKRLDYAKDVVDNIPIETPLSFKEKLQRLLRISSISTARLQILDGNGSPVHKAQIRIVGIGIFTTSKTGHATLYLERPNYSTSMPAAGTKDTGSFCSLVISYEDHAEVLYEEILADGHSYVYRPDPMQSEGRIFVLSDT